MSQQELLEQLFHHNEQSLELEQSLLESAAKDRDALLKTLETAAAAAQASSEPNSTLRLMVLAGLYTQLGGALALRRLLSMLRHEDDGVRGTAGAALAELGHDDFPALAKEIKRALEADDVAEGAEELAFLLTEIDDEETVELVLTMLAHSEPIVVAAALEVAGEWGWEPRVGQRIDELTKDDRQVKLYDEEEGEVTLTVGELAGDLKEALQAVDGDRS